MIVRMGAITDLQAVLVIQQESTDAPQWSESVWRGLLQSSARDEPLRRLFVAEQNGRVNGFLVVVLAGAFAELESVAVSSASRRKGVGRALCRHAMVWSAERGASQLELEVRARNEAARALYGSLGFVEQGVRRGYYRHPDDDAVLLLAAL